MSGGGREMDGEERRRVKTCAGGVQDETIINQVMLRFRPIAPKPATADSLSGGLQREYGKLLVTNSTRSKRKYVIRKKKSQNNGPNKKVVTLQLLPEKADIKKSVPLEEPWTDPDQTVAVKRVQENDQALDRTVVMPLKKVVESWVTVEGVTDTCIEGSELSGTDLEKMKNLEKDTCPGFISDGVNKVQWVNEAYRKMVRVSEQDDGQSSEIFKVWLVLKEKLPLVYQAFTCRVRLEYSTRQNQTTYSKTVPCDVWKMEGGGFAWRLDVKAALSLGP